MDSCLAARSTLCSFRLAVEATAGCDIPPVPSSTDEDSARSRMARDGCLSPGTAAPLQVVEVQTVADTTWATRSRFIPRLCRGLSRWPAMPTVGHLQSRTGLAKLLKSLRFCRSFGRTPAGKSRYHLVPSDESRRDA